MNEMNDLQRAVSQFDPAWEGNNGGFNPPPGPSESSWIVAPSSADELRRGQEVGESQGINMRDPTTGMPIWKAPSPGVRVEVFEIPQTPTANSGASEADPSSIGPSKEQECLEIFQELQFHSKGAKPY
uniref:Orf127c n=1 Tax=Batis maritima TaxID=4436 RepID=A0A068BF58_BATMA|nr:orf127c [Batis maritima]AIC83339.1 orf127c [Batis maritima]